MTMYRSACGPPVDHQHKSARHWRQTQEAQERSEEGADESAAEGTPQSCTSPVQPAGDLLYQTQPFGDDSHALNGEAAVREVSTTRCASR